MSYAGGQTCQAHSQEACNSLHTNKLQRPDRKSKSQNIIETLSLQSTIEFFMRTIEFTNREHVLHCVATAGGGKKPKPRR